MDIEKAEKLMLDCLKKPEGFYGFLMLDKKEALAVAVAYVCKLEITHLPAVCALSVYNNRTGWSEFEMIDDQGVNAVFNCVLKSIVRERMFNDIGKDALGLIINITK